jgi:hypothetical protein
MPEDQLNPTPDLGPFAEALRRLDPQPPNLSRDALLFAAGQAAARPRVAPWVWPSVAAGFAGLSLVLGAFAVSPGGPGHVQYVSVPQPAPPAAGPIYPPEPIDVATTAPTSPKEKARSAEDEEAVRMLQVRRDVLRWGVDMLPESRSPGGPGPSQDVAAREVTHWLHLPPGTFALPSVQPKKPEPKDADNDRGPKPDDK